MRSTCVRHSYERGTPRPRQCRRCDHVDEGRRRRAPPLAEGRLVRNVVPDAEIWREFLGRLIAMLDPAQVKRVTRAAVEIYLGA